MDGQFQSGELLILTLYSIDDEFMGAVVDVENDIAIAVDTPDLLTELDDVE